MEIKVKLDPYFDITDEGDIELSIYVGDEDSPSVKHLLSIEKVWKDDMGANTVYGAKPYYKPFKGHPEMMEMFATKLETAANDIREWLNTQKPYKYSEY